MKGKRKSKKDVYEGGGGGAAEDKDADYKKNWQISMGNSWIEN